MLGKKQKSSAKKVTLSELSNAELDVKYTEIKKELQEIRFKLVTSTVPNVRRIRALKKDIARILTIKNARKAVNAG